MTIPSTPRKAGPFAGNGAQTQFPFAFKVFAGGDVDVRLYTPDSGEVLVAPESYSVTLNANQDTSPGGTITYPLVGAPIATGARLSVIGALDYDQPLDLPSGGRFSDVALENELDRIVMQVQQIHERQDRSLTIPATSSADTTFPSPEAGALIGWNQFGTGLANVDVNTASFSTAYGERTFETFAGTGAQTVFNLASPPANIADMDLSVDGVTLVPVADYTLDSNVLTFITAPANGAEILVRYGRIPAALPFDVVAAVQGPFLLLDNTINYDFTVPTGKNALSISPTIAPGVTVTVPPDSEFITLDEYAGGGTGGEANTASNLGAGSGVFAGKTGVDLRFRSLVAGTNVTLASDANTITINAAGGGGSGEANTASNLGATGEGVFASKSGVDLRFKKLKAGTNVTLASDADSITITASGGASSTLGLFNVKDYGALGNGTNDTAAFNAAIAAAITAGGGAVWVPSGKYVLSSAVTATMTNGVGLAILGAGVDTTELKFTAGSGITITCVSEGYWAYPGSGIPHGNAITVNGLTLATDVHNTGTALTISANTLTGRPVPAINISNLTLRGTDVTKGWARGIHFDKADAANVSHLNWFGKIVTAEGTVVEITGDATHNVSAFRFSNCGFTYANIGVKAGSYVEGIHLTNVDMVLMTKGVEWLCGSTVESELGMANCHIAATLYCVHMQGLMDSHISNSLFFSSGAPTVWNGLRMDYSAATVSNCFFGGENGGSNVGIVNTNLVTGSNAWAVFHPSSITNNIFRGMPVGISLGANTGNVFVGADNQYSSEVSTRVNNSSTASLVEKRTHTGSVIFSLAGGAVSETVSITIPGNTFAAAPEAAFLVLAQNAEDLIGFYLFDVSTATNAQFIIKRRDGGVLPSGARRFSFQMSGI